MPSEFLISLSLAPCHVLACPFHVHLAADRRSCLLIYIASLLLECKSTTVAASNTAILSNTPGSLASLSRIYRGLWDSAWLPPSRHKVSSLLPRDPLLCTRGPLATSVALSSLIDINKLCSILLAEPTQIKPSELVSAPAPQTSATAPRLRDPSITPSGPWSVSEPIASALPQTKRFYRLSSYPRGHLA